MGELGGEARLESDVAEVAYDRSESIRVLCFNVRHCRGAFSPRISEPRTAKVIRAWRPDVAGITEVYRTTRRDQPARLSRLAGLQSLFHGVRPVRGGEYGNLLLAPLGLREVRRIPLGGRREARGCLIADVQTTLGTVAVAVTHLGLDAKSRRGQIAQLVRALPRDQPLILLGDFNGPQCELEPLREFLDTTLTPPPTFPSVFPIASLDRVVFSRDLVLRAVWSPFTLASDHRPLLVELALASRRDAR